MRHIEFQRFLNSDNIIRVRFELDRGSVVKFVVQLECLFFDFWTAIIRYGTARGFARCDRIHPYERTQKVAMKT